MHRRNFLATTFAWLGTLAVARPSRGAEPEYTWIFVSDMHCEACAKKISRKLYTVPGVVKVQTHLKESFAVVTHQPGKQLSPRGLWEAVEQIEFTPVKLQGPSGVFTAKPNA